jgi:hypothetical protein
MEKIIRAKVKCCSCEGSLEKGHINIIALMKVAQWQYPCWGNVLLGVHGFASAIVCDKCLKSRKKVKFAIEWTTPDLSIVKYHPVEELDDVPKEIFKPLDELEPGRHRTAG